MWKSEKKNSSKMKRKVGTWEKNEEKRKQRWHIYTTKNNDTSLLFVSKTNGSNEREYVKL